MSISACTAHTWVQSDSGYGCEACPATAVACYECGNPLEVAGREVCDKCVAYWQKTLEQLEKWTSTYRQDPFALLTSPKMDPNRVTTSEDDVRLPHGLDAIVSDLDDGRIESLKTVSDAMGVLVYWADRWARHAGDERPIMSMEYLKGRTMWALEHQELAAWEDYAADLREVRSLVRRLLGIAPVNEPVPCVYCGGRIVREWSRRGLSELRKCTRCGVKWADSATLAHTNHLVLQALPETHPTLQVTLEDANRIYRGRVKSNQLHMWVKRRRLLAVDRDFRGADVFTLEQVQVLVAQMERRRLKREEAARAGVRS